MHDLTQISDTSDSNNYCEDPEGREAALYSLKHVAQLYRHSHMWQDFANITVLQGLSALLHIATCSKFSQTMNMFAELPNIKKSNSIVLNMHKSLH